MRLIDADALKKQFPENIGVGLWHFTGVWAVIANAPTIEAEPVRHGRWVSDEADILFHCSVCETQISTSWDYDCDEMWNYCPHCGARMDGDTE